jgi:hypothetical protein
VALEPLRYAFLEQTSTLTRGFGIHLTVSGGHREALIRGLI